jgi:DNA-binding response OmpR family regulator
MLAGCARLAGGTPAVPVLARDRSLLLASPTVPKVLIATDADWIHDEVEAALADESTSVVRVRSGREVGAAMREHKPDLVVMDSQIGNMGGIATFLHLKQEIESGRMDDAGMLLLLDRPADVPLARQVGIDGWLIKPLDAFRLRKAATALLAGGDFHEPSGLASV